MVMHYSGSLEEGSLDPLLLSWRERYPDGGVLALLPERERGNLPLLQASCRKAGMPLVGAVFPELVTGGNFATHGVALLGFERMPEARLLPDLNADGADPAHTIVAALGERMSSKGDTLFLIFDAMVPNIATILDGLYLQLADRVHYMGVNAGSESFQPMPCLFDGSRIVQDGVLAIVLPQHAGAVLEHGYQAPEQMIMATSTEGNRVVTIDWRPAFEVYRELVRGQYGIEVNRDNFYHYATHFPFGILRANGEIVVRIPVALHDDGSLFCVGEVPANSMLTLLAAPEVSSTATIETIATGLAAEFGSLAGRDLLTFYCAGRRLHLGERAVDELAALAARTRVRDMLGALSLGEIGSSVEWGYPLFHNATLVCTAWGMP